MTHGLSLSKAGLVCLFLAGCAAPEDQALRALEAVGLRHPKLGLYPFFACSEDDTFNSKFTAYTREGKKITGAVCCGWVKNCTVRFD